MKKIFFGFGLLCLVCLSTTARAQVGIDLNLHLGDRDAPQPPIVVESPPEMIYLEGLRVYVAVGIPNDLFFYDNTYYYHNNGIWYRSGYYRGPWAQTDMRRIPPGLRKHRIEEVREFREHSWRDYREHSDHFEGKHFRAKELREKHDRGRHDGEKHGRGKHDGERNDRER
ncbi:MAG: hypothetical protein HYR79_05965 [Nitrospirae bacterium]|nr:hypothetical protein [Nitrospirota bacterium]